MIVLFLFIISFHSSSAGIWERIASPPAGSIHQMLSYSNSIICSIDGQGVYISGNSGETWTTMNDGLACKYINELAVNNGLIYAATNKGLYRTALGNGQWSDIGQGLPDAPILSVVINNDGDLFVAVRDYGVYRKTLMGDVWEEMNYRLPGKNVSKLAETKSGPFIIILAALEGNGIYRTSDNGETWAPANYGHGLDYVYKFEQSPNGKIYALAYDGSAWATSDGISWDKLSEEVFSDHISCLGLSYSEIVPGTNRQGMYTYSDNLGEFIASELSDCGALACTSISSGTFFAAISDSGIYASADDGLSWEYNSMAPSGVIKTFRDYDSVLVALANGAAYYSDDSCRSWKVISGINEDINDIIYRDSLFYAVTSTGLYRARHGQDSWSKIAMNNSNLYSVATGTNGRLFVGDAAGHVFASDNQGQDWQLQTLHINQPSPVKQLFTAPQGEVWAMSEHNGIYYNNSGNSWQNIFPLSSSSTFTCNKFEVTSQGHIYFCNERMLVYSDDMGQKWKGWNWTMDKPDVRSFTVVGDSIVYTYIDSTRQLLRGRQGSNQWESLDNGYIYEHISGICSKGKRTYIYGRTIYSREDALLLGKTTITYPEMGQTALPTRPEIIWEAIGDDIYYELQVADNFNFEANQRYITKQNTYKLSSPLSNNSQYFVRVRPMVSGEPGPWSDTVIFYTELQRPVIIAPDNNSETKQNSLHCIWNKIVDAEQYILQQATDFNFENITATFTVADDSSRVINFSDSRQDYYLRLKAFTGNNSSAWSTPVKVTTLILVPIPLYPGYESVNIPIPVRLEWNKDSYAGINYEIDIAEGPVFANDLIIFNTSDISASSYTFTGAIASSTYSWHIRAYDAQDTSSFAEAQWFACGNNTIPQLNSPELQVPANKSIGISRSAQLQFSIVSGEQVLYNVQVADNQAMNSPMDYNGLTDNNVSLNDLNYITDYYWRARAYNNKTQSQWSEIWKFTTRAQLPAPTLLLPGHKEELVALIGNLTWTKVDGADSYLMQMAADTTMINILNNENTGANIYYEYSGLDFLTPYYWRVKCFDDDDSSAWSATHVFYTIHDIGVAAKSDNNISAYYSANVRALIVQNFRKLSVNIIVSDIYGRTVAASYGLRDMIITVPISKCSNKQALFYRIEATGHKHTGKFMLE